MNRRTVLASGLALASVLTPFRAWRAAAENCVQRSTLYVFGTLVEVVIRGASRDIAQQAFVQIAQSFRRFHRDWNAWKPGQLTRLNADLAQGRAQTVTPDLRQLIVQAKSLSAMSGELFNPAIGRLIAAWGFHDDDLPEGPPPDDAAISRLVAAHPRMGDVQIDGNRIWSINPAVQLDVGAFAKGAALDWAMTLLKGLGVRHAVLNAGGGVQVIGRHGVRPWRVGIRHPLSWGVIAAAELAPGEALHTSGNYERYRSYQGVRFSHLIDPRSGRPAERIVSASVIAANGAMADAAATALAIAGPQGWHRIARDMRIKYALLVEADGTMHLNPEMRARLTFVGAQPKRIVTSPPL